MPSFANAPPYRGNWLLTLHPIQVLLRIGRSRESPFPPRFQRLS
jgi:hypothetical protein